MKKKYLKILKIVVSVLLLGILFSFVDFENVLQNMLYANISYLVLFVFLTIIAMLVSSYKWYVLASSQGFNKSFFFYFKIYFVGIFLNNFFPSSIGGDIYRVISLSSNKHDVSKASESVVIDRVSGLVTIIFLSSIFGIILIISEETEVIMKFIVLFIVIFAISLVLFAYLLDCKVMQKILKVLPKKVLDYGKNLRNFTIGKLGLLSVGYSTLFAFIGLALSNYILFLSLGTTINPVSFLSVIFLISIISSLPVSIGNIGIKEWAYVTLFGVFGVSATISIAVVLLSRVLQMGISVFAIPFYLANKKIIKKEEKLK